MLSPLVNLLDFNFKTTVAGEYKTVLFFFPFLSQSLRYLCFSLAFFFPHGVAVKQLIL